MKNKLDIELFRSYMGEVPQIEDMLEDIDQLRERRSSSGGNSDIFSELEQIGEELNLEFEEEFTGDEIRRLNRGEDHG